MAYANGTLHYNLPQTVGTDVRDWSDTNQAFEDVDSALFGAVSDVATASSKVNALDEELNDASTGIVAQLGQAQTDIIGLDGRVQTLEGTVANHTSQIADVRADCEDMICAFNETTSTSTHDYAIGDYFRYNDVLYEATAVINIGDTITPDTNCKTTNVTTELLDIKGAADKIGDLSTLTTTDKSNCVAAINEVNTNLADKGFKLIKSVVSDGTTSVRTMLTNLFTGVTVNISNIGSYYVTIGNRGYTFQDLKTLMALTPSDMGFASVVFRFADVQSGKFYSATSGTSLTEEADSTPTADALTMSLYQIK